jgi:hypothetical protein
MLFRQIYAYDEEVQKANHENFLEALEATSRYATSVITIETSEETANWGDISAPKLSASRVDIKNGNSGDTIACSEKIKHSIENKSEATKALWDALWTVDLEAMQKAIDQSAEVDALDKSGYTPLWHAVADRLVDMIDLLMLNGADPRLTCGGSNPLELAEGRWGSEVAVYLKRNSYSLFMWGAYKKIKMAFASLMNR